jgi:dTDP-4-dehydrorhamnose reductase
MNILVLGANGLIGSTCYRILSESSDYSVHGTIMNESHKAIFPKNTVKNIITNVNVLDEYSLINTIKELSPNVIINCTGHTKHRTGADKPLKVLPINSLFPHKLVKFSQLIGARVVHLSTDCVFSGKKGLYSEQDHPDAYDLYGISKSLGEIDYPNAITLRTSTIGHETKSTAGLLEWFLSQRNKCKGFNKAIFSGLPTVTLAKIIRDYVLKDDSLSGLYQIASEPIDKLSLLELISRVYNKKIKIITDSSLEIDRSLRSEKFYRATGYEAPSWDELITEMHKDFKGVADV